MASNDLYRSHGSGRLLPRAAQTTFQASDLLRASTNGGSCIPDSKLQKRRTSSRGANKTRPRLPQRSRYVSDNGLTTRGTLLDTSVLADSATASFKGSGPNTYAHEYLNKTVIDPENLDSGLGVEPFLGSLSDENSSTSSTDSDSDVEMDCAHTKVMHQSTADSHIRDLKQKPESHIETKDEEASYIQDDLNFKKRLEEIKRQATERYELNKTLQLLLPDSEGDTGFHHAIIHDKPNMLSKLLELVKKFPQLQTNVNDQNALFQTPLHLAVHTQQTELIRPLVEAGASLHLTDHKGNTPLHIAAKSSNSCLEEILNNASFSTISEVSQIRNNSGLTCVHMAVMANNTGSVMKLKRAGVDMNMQDHTSGRTPLHIAAEMGSFQLVQLLVQSCNSNFNATTYSGCTPLHIAAGRGQIEIVAYLISMGADPVAHTDEGDTALDLSASDSVSEFLTHVLYLLS